MTLELLSFWIPDLARCTFKLQQWLVTFDSCKEFRLNIIWGRAYISVQLIAVCAVVKSKCAV